VFSTFRVVFIINLVLVLPHRLVDYKGIRIRTISTLSYNVIHHRVCHPPRGPEGKIDRKEINGKLLGGERKQEREKRAKL
jgi:hypothetical protein